MHADIEQLAEKHFARIHRAALMLSGNPWDADDLAQETFLVAARNRSQFQGRSQVYTWLYGILLNLDRRERRRKGTDRQKLKLLSERSDSRQQTVPAAETALEVKQWKRSLWALVAQLPDGQRQALVLRFSEHLSYEQVAGALDCPLGTVKSRIFNGLAALRELAAAESSELRETPTHPREDLHHVV